MSGFWILAGDWGYALAAALFTALAIITARGRSVSRIKIRLVVALTLTALWALQSVIATSLGMPAALSVGLPETMRNAAWLALLWALLQEASPAGAPLPRGAKQVLFALGFTLVCQLVFDMVMVAADGLSPHLIGLLRGAWLLRAVFALGAIVLLQNLFLRASHDRTAQLGWIGCGLTIMWAFEFNHYLLVWFSDGAFTAIGAMRGILMVLVAPLILLAAGGPERRRIALSPRGAYRIATVVIGALYAVALFAMIMLVRSVDDPATRIVQLGAIFALSVIALILLPSSSFRAWLRVEIAKHLFAYRYDYRHEWMRFAESLDTASEDAEMPLRRAARAVARALDAPAALLFLSGEDGMLEPSGDWNWTAGDAAAAPIDGATAERLRNSEWIIDVASERRGQRGALSDWILADPRAWALVPLRHGARLIGAMLVARPPARAGLDWEDLDMLRVIARQLAVTLSDWQHQQARAEAQRFEEFNRRFAFILHDIKNLVSQMSLLAANAERHAENPAFRADMVLTLKETATRMNDLIARLARPDQPRAGGGKACALTEIARTVSATGKVRGRVRVTGAADLLVRADGEALRQALGHLVQNAVEATPIDGAPVEIRIASAGVEAVIEVIDQGSGMSAEFLRSGLFRPFASTKNGGFGLGAHEARALITAMGGRLDVESRAGQGSRFTISLLLADDSGDPGALPASTPEPERKAG
jgi:putative PEP-CTERM system histidine kinase